MKCLVVVDSATMRRMVDAAFRSARVVPGPRTPTFAE